MWPLPKIILLLRAPFNYIFKIKKLPYLVPETGKYWFIIYYLYYKDKLVSNLTRNFVCTTNYLYYLCNFNNFLATPPFLAGNYGACTVWLNLVIQKKELLKTYLYFLFCFLQLLVLFLNSIRFKMWLMISKCLAIVKCTEMSKCAIIFK